MAITDWHKHDRPREKLLTFGKASLSDAELLAIFLRVGVKGKSAVALAQELLKHFGDLHHLLQANEADFCQVKGMGQAKYVQLQAVLEMSRRHFESELSTGDAFSSPETVAQFLAHELAHQSRERFGVLFLNQKNQLIEFKILFEGTLNQANVHIREVIKLALSLNSAALIVSHNHPSGDPSPSESDKVLTRQLKQACDLMDIRLLDHMIIGNQGKWHSFAQAGQLI